MTTKRIPLFIGLSALSILAFSIAVVWADTDNPNLKNVYRQPDIPQPQGFCGYCHILTYPEAINKSYETWKKGKHNNVGCIECHYNPLLAERQSPISTAPSTADSAHIPKAPPGHFPYLKLGGETIKTRPEVSDASCMTVSCHGKPEDPFRTKKIKFTEKVAFVHEPHLAKKNQIEGMQVACTSCHQHETEVKHFQVSEATCHLCHFANTKFNQGRGQCELCHQLPTKAIQASEGRYKKPITHQMLKDGGVSCQSCHFELIRGSGETKVEPFFEGSVLKTVLFLGAGRIKNENCLVCHDQTKYLQKAGDKKEMHGRHVSTKNARCFDCHRPIEHRKAKTHDPMPNDCAACHPEPHHYQRLLAEGPEREGIQSQPDPMFKSRSNCLACHVEKEKTHKGQIVMKASSRTCVQCHTKDYEKMLGLWKRELSREIEKAEKLQAQAIEALTKNKSKTTPEKLKEANRMLESGRENLDIVRFGNGVHNAKYSMALLDLAIANFKNTIGYLEGKDISEGIRKEE